MQSRKLAMLNTLAGDEINTTWRHPRAARGGPCADLLQGQAQLDYVVASPPLARGLVGTRVLPWEFFAGVTQSDHRAVVATIQVGSVSRANRSEQKRPRPIKSRAQRDSFAKKIHETLGQELVTKGNQHILVPATSHDGDIAAEQTEAAPMGESSPESRVGVIFQTLAKAAASVQSDKSEPKKPWMKPESLQLLLFVNELRKIAAATRQGRAGCEEQLYLLLVSTGTSVPSELWSEVLEKGLLCVVNDLLRHATRHVKRVLRKDKREWFDCEAERVADLAAVNRSSDFYFELKRLLRMGKHRTTKLMRGTNGALSMCVEESDAIWQKHWATHLHGHVIEGQSAARAFESGVEEMNRLPAITEMEVFLALKDLNPRRVALDDVHGSALKAAAHVVKGPLSELYTKCVRTASVPASWYHGRLVPIHKRTAPVDLPSSYRPVTLLRNEYKLYAKIVLRRIQAEVREITGQYGCGAGRGIRHALFVQSQLSTHLREDGRPHCWVFLDVAGAFDSVVHELLWGGRESASVQSLLAAGVPEDIAPGLVAKIRSNPCVLVQAGLSEEWTSVLAGTYRFMFTSLGVGEGNSSLRVLRGTRQGDCLSALLFSLYLASVGDKVNHAVARRGVSFRIKVPRYRNLCMTDASEMDVPTVYYMDDGSLLCVGDSNHKLVAGVRDIVDVLVSEFAEACLNINFKPGKTSCMFSFAGREKAAMMQGLVHAGLELGFNVPAFQTANGTCIMAVQEHLCLGAWINATGCQGREVSVRCARTMASATSYSHALTCRKYPLKTRLCLLQQFCLTHLWQNVAIYGPLSAKQSKKMASTYHKLVRKTLRRTVDVDSSQENRRTVIELLKEAKLPSTRVLLAARKLQFVRSLALSSCPLVRGALALPTNGKGCVDVLCDSLDMLRRTLAERFETLPVPSVETWEQWLPVIVSPHTKWSSIIKLFVKKAMQDEFDAYTWDDSTGRVVVAARHVDAAPDRDDQRVMYACPDCDRTFTTHRGRESHRRCAHAYIPAHARLAKGRQCPACEAWMKSRHETVTHLRTSSKCLAWATQHITPMTDEEYKMVTSSERAVSRYAARPAAPAVGPKGLDESRKPRTRCVVPANIYEDTDDEDIPLDVLFGLED
eukprot:792543-Amphidinium_carterae.1